MPHLTRVRARRRADRTRGAAAVEAALVLPVVFLIFFAILEFGFLFKDWLGVVSSVRAGARVASAEPRTAGFADDAVASVTKSSAAVDLSTVQKLYVYEADANGYPLNVGSSFSSCSVANNCIAYTWNGTAFTSSATSAQKAAIAGNQNACPNDAAHDSVGIYLEVKHAAFTNAVFTTIIIKEHVVMSLEPMPTTNGCKP